MCGDINQKSAQNQKIIIQMVSSKCILQSFQDTTDNILVDLPQPGYATILQYLNFCIE